MYRYIIYVYLLNINLHFLFDPLLNFFLEYIPVTNVERVH